MNQDARKNTRVLSRENFLTIYLPAATLAAGSGIATVALPVFIKSFDVSVGVASQVFVAQLLGGMAATIPTGFLIDRFGRRRILLLGPAIVAASSLATAFSQTFPELLAYRFIGGWAQQMWMLSRLVMIADTGGDRQRGRQITGMFGMDTAGRLLGPPAAYALTAVWDIRASFVAHAILSLVAIIPSLQVQESAPGRRSISDQVSPGGGRLATLAGLVTYSVVIFFVAQLLASLTRGTLFSGTVNLYPVYAYGVGIGELAWITTIAGVTAIPIVFSTGAIMDRFGRKKTVVPGFALLALTLAFISFTAYAGLPLETYVLGFVAMQAAQNITSGNMQVIGSDIAPAESRGTFFGVWRLIGEVGQVASPVAYAFFAESSGYGTAFAFLGVTAISTALILATQVKEPLKQATTETETAAQVEPARTAG
jgi:MFS family permease